LGGEKTKENPRGEKKGNGGGKKKWRESPSTEKTDTWGGGDDSKE